MRIIKARKKHASQLVKMWKEFMDYHGRIDPNFIIVPGAERSYRKHLLKHMSGRDRTVLIAVDGKKILG